MAGGEWEFLPTGGEVAARRADGGGSPPQRGAWRHPPTTAVPAVPLPTSGEELA